MNENEEALLAITRELGIPDPDTNAFVILDDGGPPIRADFVWRDQRVIVEADSKKWHNTRQRFEQDRVRDQRLTAAGWTIIRTTWKQMTAAAARAAAAPPQATGTRVSSRSRLTSRCRRPRASATRHCTRRRKHFIPPDTRPVSATSDVICTPSSPHGTIQLNGSRSLSTFTANPCIETPRERWTPIDAILRSPTQTPVNRCPSCGRDRAADALVSERRHQRVLQQTHVRHHVVDAHDRVADELAGTVVGDLPAPPGVDDVDPALEVPVLTERQLPRHRPAPRVYTGGCSSVSSTSGNSPS